MKKIFLPIIVFIAMKASSQDNYQVANAFKTDIVLYEYDFVSAKVLKSSTPVIALKGDIFNIVKRHEADGYVIKFWNFSSRSNGTVSDPQRNKIAIAVNAQKSDAKQKDIIITGKSSNNKYYYISNDDFDKYTTTEFTPKNDILFISLIYLPVKMRFGDRQDRFFDFGESVTLTPAVGYKRRIGSVFSTTFISFMLGVGPTLINVDEKTAPKLYGSDTVNANGKKTIGAITPSLGIMFEKKRIQIGLMAGIDIPAGKEGREWIYKNKPWVSFGIGYQIFARKESSGSTGSETQ